MGKKTTTEQKAPPKQIEKRKRPNFYSAEYRARVVKDYTKLWSDFFRAFSEGLHERKIYESDEQSFFQIVSLCSLNYYRFEEMAGDYMKDSDKVLDVLSDTVSLSHLKALSEAQFSKLEVDWHSLFIAMNKCLGKILTMLPPEVQKEIESCP